MLIIVAGHGYPIAFAADPHRQPDAFSPVLAVTGEEVPRSLFAEWVLDIATGAAAVPYWFVR